MSKDPKYLNSWKGNVLKAIIIDNAKTWSDIKYHSQLSENDLNRALAELYDLRLIIKKNDNTNQVTNSQIISEYRQYYHKGSIISTFKDMFQKPVPRVVDDKHATMVQKILNYHPFQVHYNQLVEFTFNYYNLRGSIDVIKWVIDSNGIANFSIYEIKPELTNLGETIRQINAYIEYLSKINDPRLGQYNSKYIRSSLVVLLTNRNVELVNRFRDKLRYSGINSIIFDDEARNLLHYRNMIDIHSPTFLQF